MKQKMRQLLLAIITVLLLYGCQDDFEDHNTVPKHSITLKNYSLKEANKIPQFKIANAKAQNELRKTRKSSKSSSARAMGDFIAIDSSTVKEISFDDFTSYTMLIEKEDDSQDYFENLVIHVKDEAISEAFTIKYTPTQTPIYDESTKSYTLIGNIETTKVRGITTFFGEGEGGVDHGGAGGTGWTTCPWVLMCNGQNGGGIGPEHRATATCQHKYLKPVCSLNIQISSGCGTSPDNDNSNTGNGPGGSGTGNGSNNITTNNPITTPVIPKTPEELKLDIFKMEFYDPLIQSKKDFLTSNNPIYKEIKSYVTASINLNDDGDYISQEVEDFALEVITRVMQNPTLFKNIKPFLIEKQIDDSTLPPCAKDIVTKIKNTEDFDFAKIIAALGGSESAFTVIIKPVSLDSDIVAETYFEPRTNLQIINIDISNQHLNTGTKLAIASTIQHELIHAYLLSLLSNQIVIGTSILNTYPEIWNYYVQKRKGSLDIAHHNQMADSFINILGTALQEYNTGVPVPFGTNPIQLYKDLAWGGLKETTAYLTPNILGGLLTSLDRARITAVIKAEEENAIQNNNGIIINPISTPCN